MRFLFAGFWIASVVLAWYLGGAATDEANERLPRETPRTFQQALDEANAETEKEWREIFAESDELPSAPRKRPTGGPPGKEQPHAQAPFSLEGIETAEDASKRFMAFADAKLHQGPEGHLELFRALDTLTQNTESFEHLFEDEATMMRLLYPWVKFLVERDQRVIGMAETLYKTAAENPSWFEGTDDDTFEIFTEGLAVLLPGAVDAATLARFRGYVENVMAMPEGSLPKALRSNRGEFRRNLKWWAPPLAQEEVLEQLQDASLPYTARLELLRRVDPKELAGVDLLGILVPALEAGDRRAVSLVGKLPVGAGDVPSLDQAFMVGAKAGKLRSWNIRSYLADTNRRKWSEAQPFIETGLNLGGRATDEFANAIAWLEEKPDKDYVRSMIATYALSENTKRFLEQRCGLKE